MAKVFGQLSLPSNFAEQLLSCEIEMELSESIRPQIVVRLIELYTMGVEYYESLRSYKYVYFQKKMNELVKSPVILNQLNLSKEQQSPDSSPRGQEAVDLRRRQDQYTELKQKIASTLYHTEAKVKTIMRQSNNSIELAVQRIHQEIGSQEQQLNAKLLARRAKSKVSLQEKSTKDTLFNESQDQDMKPTINSSFKHIIDQ